MQSMVSLLRVFVCHGRSSSRQPPAPKLPLGKDTTYVNGPLDKYGYIDYEAALNAELSKGITPEKNAKALIILALAAVWQAYTIQLDKELLFPRMTSTMRALYDGIISGGLLLRCPEEYLPCLSITLLSGFIPTTMS